MIKLNQIKGDISKVNFDEDLKILNSLVRKTLEKRNLYQDDTGFDFLSSIKELKESKHSHSNKLAINKISIDNISEWSSKYNGLVKGTKDLENDMSFIDKRYFEKEYLKLLGSQDRKLVFNSPNGTFFRLRVNDNGELFFTKEGD